MQGSAALEENVTPRQPDYTFVLLHGTFAPNAKWVTEESRLAQALIGTFGPNVLLVAPRWSGKNSNRARLKAAEELREILNLLSKQHPSSRLFIIAHSHGGNVALYAMQNPVVRALVQGIACISTPFLIVTEKPQAGIFLSEVHVPPEVKELDIATFPAQRTLIITSPGDEAASFLMAGQFWRWIGRRLNIGGEWAVWMLEHRVHVAVAVLAISVVLGFLGFSTPVELVGPSRNVALLMAVVGALVFTVTSTIISIIALFVSFGPGSQGLSRKAEMLVASTPPGKWSIVQLSSWPWDPEIGSLVHSLYENPEAIKILLTWIASVSQPGNSESVSSSALRVQ